MGCNHTTAAARSSLAWAPAALFALATLSCASTPPPEEPSEPAIESEPIEKETWGPSPDEPPADPEPEPEPPAAPAGDPDAQLLPDEHDISVADCRLLAAQYAAVTRSDQAAALKPGLTEAQKKQAIASIDSVASKMQAKWSQTCEESLVGKVMDPQSLKCAVKAMTVAAFDACLNAPPQ